MKEIPVFVFVTQRIGMFVVHNSIRDLARILSIATHDVEMIGWSGTVRPTQWASWWVIVLIQLRTESYYS